MVSSVDYQLSAVKYASAAESIVANGLEQVINPQGSNYQVGILTYCLCIYMYIVYVVIYCLQC